MTTRKFALDILRANVKTATEKLQEMSKDDQAPLEDAVELGATLWETIEEAKSIIEPVKERLRKEAETKMAGKLSGTEKLQGWSYTCSVTFPTATLEVKDDYNEERLRKLLGDDFEYVFETQVKVKPRKELEQRIADLPTDKQQIILAAIKRSENTPRVGFKKGTK